MAAAVARVEIAEKIPIFFDIHTYGGHPVSAAAALANIGIIEREGLVENSARVGAYMLELLEGLRAHPTVGDVRGLGLFMAVELRDPVRNQDFPPGLHVADQVTAATMQMGLFGPRPLGGGTLVFAPPLIFTEAHADQAVDLLDTALTQVETTILATAVAR
jgi:L-2,4-diaminobutyrate transaminase